MADEHPLVVLEEVVLIGIGGFAGSNLRYFTEGLAPGLWSTLTVNALGSLLLGFILYEAIYTGLLASHSHVVVGTGFLSSFTTYSTFALQTVQAPSIVWMGANVVGTYTLGFGGILLGRALARRIDGETEPEIESETDEHVDGEISRSVTDGGDR